MKTSLLLLLLVICVVAVVGAAAMPYTGPKIFGVPWPIENIDDPTIQELGEWAVSEHVKRTNGGLKFGKVVSGEAHQVVRRSYWLVIEALDGGCEIGTYKALVCERVWTSARFVEFGYFRPAN